jgi:hypothetical protein
MLDKRRLPFASLVDLLGQRAAEQRDERAYVFLSDKGDEEANLTFGELQRRAAGVGAALPVIGPSCCSGPDWISSSGISGVSSQGPSRCR